MNSCVPPKRPKALTNIRQRSEEITLNYNTSISSGTRQTDKFQMERAHRPGQIRSEHFEIVEMLLLFFTQKLIASK